MAQFDGPNLVITLNAPTGGTLDVNVQDDLYEPWKEWVRGIIEFDTSSDVSTGAETITFVDHSYYTGQRVLYSQEGGSTNIGLTDGTEYYVREIDRDTFELYDTKVNAEGSPSTTGRQNLTSGASETHSFFTDNQKFLPAFRSSGGDPLTPGVEAGAYFFLRNDLGWRIVSTDADQTVNYQGNLVGESATTSLINVTTGRSVLHLGLQPVTQRVDEILTSTQLGQYMGQVVIDTVNGSAGTAYPKGTAFDAVNNWADAKTIATTIGFEQFRIRNAIIFNGSEILDNYAFIGLHAVDSLLTFAGDSVDGLDLTSLSLTGTMGTGYVVLKQGTVFELDDFEGTCFQVAISGTVQLASTPAYGSRRTSFFSCYSDVPGTGRPTLDLNGTSQDVQVRDYSGGLTVTNMTAGNAMSIDLVSGTVEIASSCTSGTVVVRGTGILIDNSGVGVTVTKDGLITGEDARLARDHSRATNAQTQIA